MQLRLTFGRVTVLELILFEVEDGDGPEPDALHDLSTSHEIGFSAAPGWRDPVPEQDE